jgi:hypothetical protein
MPPPMPGVFLIPRNVHFSLYFPRFVSLHMTDFT